MRRWTAVTLALFAFFTILIVLPSFVWGEVMCASTFEDGVEPRKTLRYWEVPNYPFIDWNQTDCVRWDVEADPEHYTSAVVGMDNGVTPRAGSYMAKFEVREGAPPVSPGGDVGGDTCCHRLGESSWLMVAELLNRVFRALRFRPSRDLLGPLAFGIPMFGCGYGGTASGFSFGTGTVGCTRKWICVEWVTTEVLCSQPQSAALSRLRHRGPARCLGSTHESPRASPSLI